MQRSGAAAGVEVKRVIGALCRLLAAVGLEPVPPPEAFRRAKFGGKAEADPFWQLLSSILQTSGIISSETSCQLRAGLRELVSAGLWRSGYHAAWTHGADAGGVCSSDLLLALGWLLATGALETLLAGRLQRLDHTLLSSAPETREVSAALELDAASLRRLQWLMGRLRHQGRTLLSTIGTRTRALHDVLYSSQVCSAAPPAGRSSAALKQDCSCLQQLCELLEAYVSWKGVEKVFWTWMDSVADRRLSDLQVTTSSQKTSMGACHQGGQRMEGLLRGRADPQVEGAAASLPPSLSSGLSAPCLHQVCRARLRAEKRLRRPSEGPHGGAPAPHGGAPAPGELPASQAAQLLLQEETQLLQRRDRRRLANRKQLQGLMGSLDQRVFIAL